MFASWPATVNHPPFRRACAGPIQGRMAGAPKRLVGLCALVACVFAFPGCGAEDHPRASAPVLSVVEKDFKITAPRHVSAGDLSLVVRNSGPDDHELIFVRARDASTLPIRADGLTVDEDAVERAEATAIEPRTAHSVTRLRVHLAAGRYVMLCNMSGHFGGGMQGALLAICPAAAAPSPRSPRAAAGRSSRS